ncbi:hypothetical protein RJ639_032945 [Escallonia herrerae]|uniref:Uncharacterized protein n=1 Tax=Escallonia herrerae TaxID=1293975 RepID=A0AA89BG79_9ASTE|nr:hypothetical protein RJ639_032945 [Escallonia herrerae]
MARRWVCEKFALREALFIWSHEFVLGDNAFGPRSVVLEFCRLPRELPRPYVRGLLWSDLRSEYQTAFGSGDGANLPSLEEGSGNEFPGNLQSYSGRMLASRRKQGVEPPAFKHGTQRPFPARLRNNTISGEIPISIGNLSLLNVLKLENNRLDGHILQEVGLLGWIRTFNVANNHLSGPVPTFSADIPIAAENYTKNLGLYGYP